ncbi:uncharacterized protein LOC123290762 [Chrysoperla carnea]|uniref:uncharacterized protein LOC123290762 n=1 Tax=Chrysoperla carnea TaxID=189513 RepID=UPI001D0768C4|nr:uncharacterized protein LOC123290762 [Chrysoperla carnea]
MSNHVFDIFNSSSRNSTKVTSKINGGKSHVSNNFQPVKPLEASQLRIKSSSGLNIRQPLADCRPNNKLNVQTTVKPSPLKPKEIPKEKIDHYNYIKCEDTYEDILPKHKRVNVDDIKTILSCFATPTPCATANKQVNFPSMINVDDNFNKRNDYNVFEDLELSPPKNPFFDEDWNMF